MSNPTCPVCRSTSSTVLGEKRGHAYVRCMDCGLVYAPNLPTKEQFAASYGEYGVNHPGTVKVLRKTLKLWPLILTAKSRLPESRKVRFLDIGANTGYNTAAAAHWGCDAHGLETNPGTIAIARREFPDCTFHEQTIEQLAATGIKFDVLYCSEVIEHVPDPHAFVAALAALSNPWTTLFITTPDAGHHRVPEDFLSWSEVIPIQHLRLYDGANLARLLGEHGFKVDFDMPMHRANLRLYCSRV